MKKIIFISFLFFIGCSSLKKLTDNAPYQAINGFVRGKDNNVFTYGLGFVKDRNGKVIYTYSLGFVKDTEGKVRYTYSLGFVKDNNGKVVCVYQE